MTAIISAPARERTAAVTKATTLYPGFVNLAMRDDGSCIVTVRGDPEGDYCGPIATVHLSPEDWSRLVREADL